MAQDQDSMDRLWQLAERLGKARQAQAKSQSAYLAQQRKNQAAENRTNWFGPTLGGAATGAMTGAMMGSVVPGLGTGLGALAGAGIGALGGFAGRESFNQNPSLMPMAQNTALSLASMQQRQSPAMEYANQNPVAGSGAGVDSMGMPLGNYGGQLEMDPELDSIIRDYEEMESFRLKKPGDLGR